MHCDSEKIDWRSSRQPGYLRAVIPMNPKSVLERIRRFLKDEEGLSAVDYIVVGALLLIVYPYVFHGGGLHQIWNALVRLLS